MNSIENHSTHKAFYFLIIGIVLLIVSPYLFSEGMFMDGLMYATIAHNLSEGIGTFWNPQFTSTCLSDFHEHPPLAMYMQSIAYTLFGECRWIDKGYSVFTFLIVGFIIVKIWEQLKYPYPWLPLLFWLSTPVVQWACSNNMLENTLTIFTSLSIFAYLKSSSENKFIYTLVSGCLLSLGFLTKGFVAFYPWTFPFLMWLFTKHQSLKKIVVESLAMIFCSIIPLIALVSISTEAKLSLTKYLKVQVIKSLQKAVTVDTRLFIIFRLFTELLPAFTLMLIFIIWARIKKYPLHPIKLINKQALVFIACALCGVLPILISMKQSGFYILSTYPLFAIGISVFMLPYINHVINSINIHSIKYSIFTFIAYAIFIIGLLTSFYFSNHIGRNQNKIHDVKLILSKVDAHSTIKMNANMWQDWSLHGYFYRYKNVSLDSSLSNRHKYFLIERNLFTKDMEEDYQIVPLQTNDYLLLQLK